MHRVLLVLGSICLLTTGCDVRDIAGPPVSSAATFAALAVALTCLIGLRLVAGRASLQRRRCSVSVPRAESLSVAVFLLATSAVGLARASASVDAGATTDASAGALPPAAEVLRDLVAIEAAARAHNATALRIAIAALVAIALRFVLQAIKSRLVLSEAGKRAIPWICLALGVLLGVADRLALGDAWVNAIVIGGSAPAAVLVHELLSVFERKPATGLLVIAILAVGSGTARADRAGWKADVEAAAAAAIMAAPSARDAAERVAIVPTPPPEAQLASAAQAVRPSGPGTPSDPALGGSASLATGVSAAAPPPAVALDPRLPLLPPAPSTTQERCPDQPSPPQQPSSTAANIMRWLAVGAAVLGATAVFVDKIDAAVTGRAPLTP